MVLTNIECWAHVGIGTGQGDTTARANDFDMRRSSNRSVDMFNPSAVSHISSNGYYGFSHVNNLKQGHINDNNNNADNFELHQITDCGANVNDGIAVRCKKRFYTTGDSEFDSFLSEAAAGNVSGAAAAKRCRYDEESDMAAQYCNDFFSLPVTQISTQSCLMDIEDQHQQQQHNKLQCQPQVYFSEAMVEDNALSNGTHQQISATEQVAQQPLQQYDQTLPKAQNQQHHHHQHTHHYQGHLHRANRDVSRCMMSHMI